MVMVFWLDPTLPNKSRTLLGVKKTHNTAIIFTFLYTCVTLSVLELGAFSKTYLSTCPVHLTIVAELEEICKS
jgi:hypothetical protein